LKVHKKNFFVKEFLRLLLTSMMLWRHFWLFSFMNVYYECTRRKGSKTFECRTDFTILIIEKKCWNMIFFFHSLEEWNFFSLIRNQEAILYKKFSLFIAILASKTLKIRCYFHIDQTWPKCGPPTYFWGLWTFFW